MLVAWCSTCKPLACALFHVIQVCCPAPCHCSWFVFEWTRRYTEVRTRRDWILAFVPTPWTWLVTNSQSPLLASTKSQALLQKSITIPAL
jgi:hypothetical protein